MRSLIKIDLVRIFKDKLFLIAAIITGAFSVFTPLLYKLLFSMLDTDGIEGAGSSMFTPSARDMFFTAFTPGNNLGLIVPIFVTIILCKDFSWGTVRNKLISGKRRWEVFLSTFISCSVTMCAFMLTHALLSLAVSLIFFDYGVAFNLAELGYMLLSTLLELLVYVLISALISFFSVLTRKAGVAVVLYFAMNFFFSIVGSITMIVSSLLSEADAAYAIVTFLDRANIFTSSVIGGGVSYSLSDILYVLVPTLVGSALLVLLGIKLFSKKDLK